MKHAFRIAIAASLAALFCSAALAADKDKWDWAACKTEIEKWCKDSKGGDAIWGCLEDHDSKLSRSCDTVHTKYEVTFGNKK